MSTFVSELEICHFGAIQQVQLSLQPLHALIGPNDSGKSTILRALQLASLVHTRAHSSEFRALLRDGFKLRVTANTGDFFEIPNPLMMVNQRDVGGAVAALFKNVKLLRLDPDDLRAKSKLIADSEKLWFANERGQGLGSLVDAILARDFQRRLELEQALTRTFPPVEKIRLFTATNGEREIGILLKNGTEIRPQQMSEGMLYFLAFQALRFIDPPSMLLVEEPENGLHPARIAEVMTVLREISKHTQVVIATHSPLVVNELEGNEITLVTRTEEAGTRCTRLDQTHNYVERRKVYNHGELWLSYADGSTEGKLVGSGER